MAIGRLEIDGVGLHVEVDGPDDGTPVLFLHGVGSSARTWDWLPPTVTRGRRIVRVDQRGHGRSDHATGTYVLARYGADAVAVLRERVAGPALIIGSTLASTDTRALVAPPVMIVAADDGLGAAFSSDDAVRLTSSGQRAQVVRIIGSGHRIHQSRRHRSAYVEHVRRFLAAHDDGSPGSTEQ